jgi:hypothetical protein
MPVPLAFADTAAVHLKQKVDSLWEELPCQLVPSATNVRRYNLVADLQKGNDYSIDVDSGAFVSIYGVVSKAIKQTVKVKTDEDYSVLEVAISGVDAGANVIVQLLSQDKPVKQQLAVGGLARFLYVVPGKYYLRAFVDDNGNGVWDTGDYDEDRQAEAVYYYNEEIECKQKWEVKKQWNLTAIPRHQQKPAAITKQKGEQQRKIQNRNLQRAKQLGIQYIQDKTGIRL